MFAKTGVEISWEMWKVYSRLFPWPLTVTFISVEPLLTSATKLPAYACPFTVMVQPSGAFKAKVTLLAFSATVKLYFKVSFRKAEGQVTFQVSAVAVTLFKYAPLVSRAIR